MEIEIVRKSIRNFLNNKPRNTVEISSWLSQMNISLNLDLAKFLEADEFIVRIGEVRNSGVIDPSYSLSEWATMDWTDYHGRKSEIN